MIQIIFWFAVVYAAVVAVLFVAQRSMMYQPGASLPPLSTTLIPDAEPRITEPSPGLHLTSWYLPPAEGKPVILYFQGNAGTIADRDFKAAPLAERGYGVWLTGYRGFGGNPGSPSEQGLYADARTALKALEGEGVEAERIVIYGESLGTGVATQMAWELALAGTPAKGLVLEAPFSSMRRAAQDHYFYVPAKWLVRDHYDNQSKIADIDTAVLIMHGARDRVVKQRHGKRVFDAAREPKTGVWPDDAAHSDLYDHGALATVAGFLEKLER